MKTRLSVVGLLFVPLVSLAAPSPKPAPSCSAWRDVAGRILHAYATDHSFSGTALVAKQTGKTDEVFLAAEGFADTAHKVKNTAETRFRIGSLTKQFTGEAIRQLRGEGLLKKEDFVHVHLKGFPKKGNAGKVTIRDLLKHQSGLPEYSEGAAGLKSTMSAAEVEKVVLGLLAKRGSQPPGKKYEYRNTNYFLLGRIVEAKSGLSYADYLAKKVFIPLGMNNSGVGLLEGVANHAKGFREWGDSPTEDKDGTAYGSGAMYSTAPDLYRWAKATYPESLFRKRRGSHFKEGYGWGVERRYADIGGKRYQTFEHGGTVEGYASYLTYFPQEQVTVVLLSNFESGEVQELGADLARAAIQCRPTPAH